MPDPRPVPTPPPQNRSPDRGGAKGSISSIKYTAKYLLVLDAAARQFSEKGYHVATTKDIAESLGVQQGSLYYYIRSKEAALEQICFVAMKGYVDFSAEVRHSRKPTTQKIQELIRSRS
jgi:TetR/AcrR family transcriptional regulator, cholesterol catabolism regulator